MKGTVSKYLTYRGYGFIEYDESETDIFFHSSNFQSTEIPSENQQVEFRVIETPKGKEAVDVKLVQSDIDEPEEEVIDDDNEDEKGPVEVKGLDELEGIGPKYLELLEASDIKSVKSLTEYTPEDLLTNLLQVNESNGITKRPPTLSVVEKWIEAAGNWS